MQTQLFAKLKERNDLTIIENAPMKDYTSFQIGGPADILIQPETKEALAVVNYDNVEVGDFVVEDVEYIPLETTDKSLLGRIDKVLYRQNKF